MFERSITTIPIFADSESYGLFPQISFSGEMTGDVVIPAVMRALIWPRIKDTEKKFSMVETTSAPVIDYSTLKNILILLNYKEAADMEIQEGWQRLQDVEAFIANRCKCTVRIAANDEKCVAIVYGEINMPARHTLAALLPRLFRTIFMEAPLTSDETELVRSLAKPFEGPFLDIIKRIPLARQLNRIKTIASTRELTKMYFKRRYDSARERLGEARSMVEESLERYSRAVKEEADAITMLEGARVQMENGSEDTQLFEYLSDNDTVEVLSCNNGRLEIMIDNYLDVYDADSFENFNSYFFSQVYNDVRRVCSQEDMELLLKALFTSDPKLHVRTTGFYILNVSGECRTRSGFDMTGRNDRIPNPHIFFHSCLGQYAGLIQEKLRAGDLIGAITTCNASTMSINVNESLTFRPFIEKLFKHTGKVLETFDGKKMTVKEAIAWLKEAKE